MIYVELYVSAFLLNLLAGIITMFIVRKHGPDCEGNPIVRFFIKKKIVYVLPITLIWALMYLYSITIVLGPPAVFAAGMTLNIAFGVDLIWDISAIPFYFNLKPIEWKERPQVDHKPNLEVLLVIGGFWKLR